MINYNTPNGNFQQVSRGQQNGILGQLQQYGNNNYNGYSNYYQPNQFLKCRPVSSKEEAMAFQIDLDGSLWVFTDITNNKIYTKQINTDGIASFKTYALYQQPIKTAEPLSSENYVTKEEFKKVVQELVNVFKLNSNTQTETQPLNF